MQTRTDRREFARILASAVLSLIAANLVGCAGVRKRVKKVKVMPNMLDNDPAKLAEQFKKIVWKKTTRADLEALGFKLETKNVPVIVGVPAFRELFGQDVFQGMRAQDLDARLPELNRYSLVQIPLQDTVETSDRLFLNKKTTTLVGWEMMFTVVMHDDLVVYAAPRQVYHDETRTDKAFLRGLIEIFSEIGQIVGVVRL